MANQYASVEKLRERMTDLEIIKALNDDPANQKSIDHDRVGYYIELANQNIDDALRGRYELPLVYENASNSDAVLEDIALKIARYEIIMKKRIGDPPAGVDTAYNDAMARLNAYRTGELTLDARPSIKRRPVITSRTGTGRISNLLSRF